MLRKIIIIENLSVFNYVMLDDRPLLTCKI